MNGQVRDKLGDSLSRPLAAMMLCLLLAAPDHGLAAQATAKSGKRTAVPSGNIYSCVAADGRRITSDRPIDDCEGQEQRLHNSDGSVRKIMPPTLSATERARQEAREREENARRVAQQDLARRDRNLMLRYPDEAAHQSARESSLETVRIAMRASEVRMNALAAERKPLQDEAEFYKGQPLPAKLSQQLDANDAATDAQRAAIQNQQAELERVQRLYDVELERLKKLWAGAAPGSLGPMASLPTGATSHGATK